MGEPHCAGVLDARGHALKGHVQVFDALEREVAVDDRRKGGMREQVRGIARDAGGLADRTLPQHALAHDFLPHLRQPLRSLNARVGRDEGPIERADARSHHEIGNDPRLGERAHHTHLRGTQHTPAAEDVCRARTHEPSVGRELLLGLGTDAFS